MLHAKIRASDIRLSAYTDICRSQFAISDPNKPPIEVVVRWSSAYKMLLYSVEYGGPLNAFVTSEPKIPDSLRLTTHERRRIKTISDLLAVRITFFANTRFLVFFLCFPFPHFVFPSLPISTFTAHNSSFSEMTHRVWPTL